MLRDIMWHLEHNFCKYICENGFIDTDEFNDEVSLLCSICSALHNENEYHCPHDILKSVEKKTEEVLKTSRCCVITNILGH